MKIKKQIEVEIDVDNDDSSLCGSCKYFWVRINGLACLKFNNFPLKKQITTEKLLRCSACIEYFGVE